MNINSFSKAIEDKLKLIGEEISHPKGYILFNSNRVERNIYIIRQGIARAFIEADGKEITIWFGQEHDIILSANGYVDGKSGYETMELLEESVLFKINLISLAKLYQSDIEMCNWARQLIEKEFVRTEHHLISILSQPASDRYSQLLHEKPEILQRVQLRHIASYLGITSEHLSRIRAKKF
ncbi:Crp/Fnr family transcriptional regulator [Sanguibacteroides justesenii]|uniref:Cyclic nucleotide-binding protein n=1 Tax=Sanguibacteroides justesenii TaxID=1547597 RepID=A0A0C3MCM1_9PORP|nr:Crp/Fnr family transcriptional regulator [Sanguibacteroides justesenii]KIO44178.1 cyclic nucleotide-binding protein [Sanguibacteroides justesenii]PXZ43795.1 Crp/Fnr family transcriptional regulator [Sanguibacteroides justesenii]